MKKNKKSLRVKQASNLFAKHRSAIWIQLLTIIVLLIFLPFAKDFIAVLFSTYVAWSAPVTVFYFLFFNLAYVAIYNVSKKSLVTNLIAGFLILLSGTMAILFIPTSRFQAIMFSLGIYLSCIPMVVATWFSFIRGNQVDKYLGFKETLFDLKNFKFKVNNQDVKLELYIGVGHVNVEINKTRRKFNVSKIHSLEFKCASVFNKPGTISFAIGEDIFSYSYYSALEDAIMFALAYNLIRVQPKAFEKK
ncbi:hypothetical protein [Spiroplasma alleghenense]|uniref:Uncharacterized protein n=1 Tax=Spiroplasma alleghenense TaxID=216931 RepID=A0A345Z2Q1_9MOLU|nr:hypothetical protein [Spiroplasma alleghenense]AXK50880.1 hypothetical protein SALLE_v1c02040 [Spiroplasma alleghenense]